MLATKTTRFGLLILAAIALAGCGEKYAGLSPTATSNTNSSSSNTTTTSSTGAPNLVVTGNKHGKGSVFDNIFVADGGPTTPLDGSNSSDFSNGGTTATSTGDNASATGF
jgi:hypothetical protein